MKVESRSGGSGIGAALLSLQMLMHAKEKEVAAKEVDVIETNNADIIPMNQLRGRRLLTSATSFDFSDEKYSRSAAVREVCQQYPLFLSYPYSLSYTNMFVAFILPRLRWVFI